MEARRIHVTGVVQGVGFRPYVWSLAGRLALAGWVRNSSSGVDILIEGEAGAVDAFARELREAGPPLARVTSMEVEPIPVEARSGFEIKGSREEEGAYLPVSPDMATCPDCLREMRDSADRRHRYPFINCTNCGPRFTIVLDIPYDRPKTTMAPFPLCRACAAEYEDPADRRFHAQPVACPECGPRIRLEEGGGRVAEGDDALRAVRARLAEGAVVAVKGLGGFHLACDAASATAVARLRERKRREGKPFAMMAADADTVNLHAVVTEGARALLESPERPVVLLETRPGAMIAPEVAPGRERSGFMLPYTPLHHLLLEPAPGYPEVLVMTSGNLSDEPIAYEDDDAGARLGALADCFLRHDRDIHMRCDDSVVAEFRGAPYFFRRARGYAPLPLTLSRPGPSILAAGGEMKNAFCLTRDDLAFLSHHIGELGYLETFRSFEAGLEHYQRLFRIEPEAVAHDLHPDYQATRYALARARRDGLPAVAVQHHHAHVAACLADHGLAADEPVIGFAFDGTGYGPDGAVWGGEVLVADHHDYERALHLTYCPLPGGDAAVRNPYRIALAWLRQAGVGWDEALPPVAAAGGEERALLRSQLEQGVNAPPTSSMGRLFDAVGSLTGLRHRITYEAQAACELEAVIDPGERGAYAFALGETSVDAAPVIRAIVADLRAGLGPPVVAARFHRGVAALTVAAARRLREARGLERVALSGGVWQNLSLLELAVEGLEQAGFETLVHRRVPANDGGLALGQAVVAAARLETGARSAGLEAPPRAQPTESR